MIKIVTDSTAYLPESTIRHHDIRIVPLYVHFGEEAFKEGVELSNEAFYARLGEAPTLPTTSQPSAGEFHQVFKELADEGHEIVVLTISSKLSGTWNSAMAAKEMLPGAAISVVDSLTTSVGLQLMVETAAGAVANGVTRQELADQLEEMKQRIHIFFAVDTLEYLAKGGRIGNAKAFLGTLLKVKPILSLQDGAIEPLEQVRTRRKALDRMLDLVVERASSNGTEAKVAVAHALALEEAGRCKSELLDRLDCGDLALAEIGPVIGTHTGPGVIGIAVCI
jgi:DegV family protein with EDD domain